MGLNRLKIDRSRAPGGKKNGETPESRATKGMQSDGREILCMHNKFTPSESPVNTGDCKI